MLNTIKKISSKYTGILIRMDDISENMNWSLMDKCESLFDKYKVKFTLMHGNVEDGSYTI